MVLEALHAHFMGPSAQIHIATSASSPVEAVVVDDPLVVYEQEGTVIRSSAELVLASRRDFHFAVNHPGVVGTWGFRYDIAERPVAGQIHLAERSLADIVQEPPVRVRHAAQPPTWRFEHAHQPFRCGDLLRCNRAV